VISNNQDLGKEFEVLIEGDSKRDENAWMGRSSQNKVIVFPKSKDGLKPGDYVRVKIETCTKATLMGSLLD
jgi:tRNA-2-methylthio-N6-dimethylallyladenosine synthase